MAKIVYIPLDERPCNRKFPYELFHQGDYQIITPPLAILPKKRQSGSVDALQNFLTQETKDADGLVLCIDTLLYGGLVPSRIHTLSDETIAARFQFLATLKAQNPRLVIFACQVIMRSPQYNGADEEPLYYKVYGEKIFQYGRYLHKHQLQQLTPEQKLLWDHLDIPEDYLQDFIQRRQLNLSYNLKSLDYLQEQKLDFLIMCQDDAAEFGFPAMDQEVITKAIKAKHLRLKAYAYSGADELGVILVARMMAHLEQRIPKFYVKYPSPTSPMVVPCLEDRYLDNTIKYQILSAGGMIVSSIEEADIILVVLMGANKMFPKPVYHDREIDVCINLIEAFEFIKHYQGQKHLAIADLLYLNAGSLDVLDLLKEANLLTKVAAYSGWNTASNALGTAVAQAISVLLFGYTREQTRFLFKRYVEDVGYCGLVRSKVTEQLPLFHLDYFHVDETKGVASLLVKQELEAFIRNQLAEVEPEFHLDDVQLPWKRMFEVDFDIVLTGE